MNTVLRDRLALLALPAVIAVVVLVFIMRGDAPDRVPAEEGARAQSPLHATYAIDGASYALSGERSKTFMSDDGFMKRVVTVFGEPTFGDLDGDGDDDAVVLLTVDAGGSGSFYYAALAVRGSEGVFVGSSAAYLGDRIAPQTVEVRDGKAVVNFAERGMGEDFSVAPSIGKSMYLSIDPGTTTTIVHPNPDPALDLLRSKTWIWTGTHMNDGSETVPKKADAFTAMFGADGRVSFTTDCNAMSGTYEAGNSRLVFGPIASTLMFCEGSQEQAFAAKLAEVQSFLFVDGKLILEIKYDSGTMVFR